MPREAPSSGSGTPEYKHEYKILKNDKNFELIKKLIRAGRLVLPSHTVDDFHCYYKLLQVEIAITEIEKTNEYVGHVFIP